jgi:hypothetical protein
MVDELGPNAFTKDVANGPPDHTRCIPVCQSQVVLEGPGLARGTPSSGGTIPASGASGVGASAWTWLAAIGVSPAPASAIGALTGTPSGQC